MRNMTMVGCFLLFSFALCISPDATRGTIGATTLEPGLGDRDSKKSDKKDSKSDRDRGSEKEAGKKEESRKEESKNEKRSKGDDDDKKEEKKDDRKDSKKGDKKSDPPKFPSKMPNRVRVYNRPGVSTVRGANNELLRGIPISIFQYRRDVLKEATEEPVYPKNDYIFDRNYYRFLKTIGINAIRLVAFDPWQRSHGDPGSGRPYPYADFLDPVDVEETRKDMDAIVAIAAEVGMYVMINYHDTGGYQDPIHDLNGPDATRQFEYANTMTQLQAFWGWVAPRYRDCTHVFYELTNEPVGWHPNDYTSSNLEDFATIYRQVRRDAPKTHIVLCSFATPASWNPERTMLDIAIDLKDLGVDYRNASIAFHPYQIAELDAAGYDSEGRPILDMLRPIVDVMRSGIPVINTEQGFPSGMIDTGDPNAPPLFPGHSTGVESMESMGISWFHWNTTGPEEIGNLFTLLHDAIVNDYFWLFRSRCRD